MAWIRLFDQEAADGEEVTDIFEMSAVPDVGDRLVLHSYGGEASIFEVVGRTFEVAFDEDGETDGETRVTLDVARLRLVPEDDDEEAPEQSH